MDNHNGLDEGYFKGKLQLVLKDIPNYTPQGLSMELARLSKTADSDTASLEVLGCPPDNTHQIIKNCFRESQGLRERIAELEARLEIDPRTKYDGIACRDICIEEQEKYIESLVGELASVSQGDAMYEHVRTLCPREFSYIWNENLLGNGRFDDLILVDMRKRKCSDLEAKQTTSS